MSNIDFDQWFNNTVVTKPVHTDDVMVATFQHPGTILYSTTYTFLAHPWSIQITGDAGQAVFSPTWNPVKQFDYHNDATGYLLEKLDCCLRDGNQYTDDDVESDWQEFLKSNEDESIEYIEAARKFIDICIIPNMDVDDSFERMNAARSLLDDSDISRLIDTVDVPELLEMGARPNGNKLIYIEGLRRLEKCGAFDKSVDRIVIGNPDNFRR